MADCVVVTLGGHLAAAVEAVWARLEERWPVGRAHRAESPHVTLAVLRGGPDPAAVRAALEPVAAGTAPFPVTGAGFGVFAGHGDESPVVHLSLTRTPRLSALHAAVVAAATAAGGDVDGQTMPEFWRPHVTLADAGLTPALAAGVVDDLLTDGPRHWTVQVDNVAFVAAEGGVAFRLALAGAPAC